MACQKVYVNKVGMMHESKGEHICKAPSLHLFHTTVRLHARELNLHPSIQLLMLTILELSPPPLYRNYKLHGSYLIATQ